MEKQLESGEQMARSTIGIQAAIENLPSEFKKNSKHGLSLQARRLCSGFLLISEIAPTRFGDVGSLIR